MKCCLLFHFANIKRFLVFVYCRKHQTKTDWTFSLFQLFFPILFFWSFDLRQCKRFFDFFFQNIKVLLGNEIFCCLFAIRKTFALKRLLNDFILDTFCLTTKMAPQIWQLLLLHLCSWMTDGCNKRMAAIIIKKTFGL